MGLFKDCGCGCNGKKQEQKFLISIMSALVFFVVANPETFRVMRKVFGSWVSSPTGCPSTRWSRTSHGCFHARHMGYDEHKA